MDLLPRPTDPAFLPYEVHLLAVEPYAYRYDYKGFSDYPERCGWDGKNLLKGDFEGRRSEDVVAFVQSWLYFGMAAELLRDIGGKYLLSDIENVLTEPDSQIIQNGPLLEIAQKHEDHLLILLQGFKGQGGLVRFAGEGKRYMEKWVKEEMKRIDDILDEVRLYLRSVSQAKVAGTVKPVVPEEIVLSIATLGDMFAAMRNVLFVWGTAYQTQKPEDSRLQKWEHLMGYGVPQQIGSDGSEKIYSWGDTPLLWQRLLDQGWCRSDLTYLDEKTQTSSQIYISNLRRHRTSLQHTNCTETQCRAYDVEDEFEHDHRPDCSRSASCTRVSIPLPTIQKFIEEGNIPVVTAGSEGSTRLNVESHSKVGEHGFVAISHVWSDGLGNPEETALFSCQLDRLQTWVNNLSESPPGSSIPFWLDTLCVPLSPPDVRRQAIECMAYVYREASHVLVLDAELVQIPHTVGFLEALFRIALSGWNRRLWTLQEGVLAKKLWFQFKGGARSLDSLYEALVESQIGEKRMKNRFGIDPVRQDAMNMNLHHTSIARSTGSKRLTALAQALQRRSCMAPSDESIVLATMLQLDLKQILNIPESRIDDRMAIVWSSQETIPQSIFRLPGAKLVHKSLPWAPKSLMGAERIIANSRITFQQQNGAVVIDCAAFVLDPSPQGLTFPVTLTPETFSKDGILIRVDIALGEDVRHFDIQNSMILIPDISGGTFIDQGGRVFDGLLVSWNGLNLPGEKIQVKYETQVLILFFESHPDPGKPVSRPNEAIDITIVIPPKSRAGANYFGNAFGFTGTRTNGLVKDYLPAYLGFWLRKMVLLLRYLSVWKRIADSASSSTQSIEYKTKLNTAVQHALTDAVSVGELVSAYNAMDHVIKQICSTQGHEPTTMSEAVDYVRENISVMQLSSMFNNLMNARMVGGDRVTVHDRSGNGKNISDLVDEDFVVIRQPALRQQILSSLNSLTESLYAKEDSREEPDPKGRDMWPKLLMAFVTQDLESIKEFYPKRQIWCMNYSATSTNS